LDFSLNYLSRRSSCEGGSTINFSDIVRHFFTIKMLASALTAR